MNAMGTTWSTYSPPPKKKDLETLWMKSSNKMKTSVESLKTHMKTTTTTCFTGVTDMMLCFLTIYIALTFETFEHQTFRLQTLRRKDRAPLRLLQSSKEQREEPGWLQWGLQLGCS